MGPGIRRDDVVDGLFEERSTPPSFRSDAKQQTRNLEIPRCAIAHLRFVTGLTPAAALFSKADGDVGEDDPYWRKAIGIAGPSNGTSGNAIRPGLAK